jgi:large subunit ribosomal protein L5
MARLKKTYFEEIRPEIQKEFGFSSPMMVPKIEKITLNMGVGDAKTNAKLLDAAVEQMAQITGQRPILTRARVSVANFKLREGMPIGCKVTLRGDRMYEFLDRLLTIALPRIRDFRGINGKSFDKQGNFAIGLKEQVIFPEIDYDEVDTVRGLDVIFTISGSNVDASRALLTKFGMPFVKPQTQAQPQ